MNDRLTFNCLNVVINLNQSKICEVCEMDFKKNTLNYTNEILNTEDYSKFFNSSLQLGNESKFGDSQTIGNDSKLLSKSQSINNNNSLELFETENSENCEDVEMFDDSGDYSKFLHKSLQGKAEVAENCLSDGCSMFNESFQLTNLSYGSGTKSVLNKLEEQVVSNQIENKDNSNFDWNNLQIIENDDFSFNIEDASFIEVNDIYDTEKSNFIKNELENSLKNQTEELSQQQSNSTKNNSCISEEITLNWSSSTDCNTSSKSILTSSLYDCNKMSPPKRDIQILKEISSWNLPKIIEKQYEIKGITKMFDWQVECLTKSKVVFEHKNLVYSAPTAAGKTLVSEILMIKTIIERHKKALIILPFISIVREKMYYLQNLLSPAGYRVEGFFGGYSPPGGFDSIHVAICTIEKANSIVNRLLEQDKLSDIGVIIVDEVHLIGDSSRGYILELLLAKTLYMCRKFDYKIQVIAMSATLSNIELLKQWLDAELYVTYYRPVELKEMIKIGQKIYDTQMNFIRELQQTYCIQNDQDHIVQLCLETVFEGCSVIVFCPSKDWCESLSLHIASSIYSILIKRNETESEYQQLCQFINKKNLEEIKIQMKNIPTGLDKVLEKTITYGCAFHHAGLTVEERDLIETSFRNGLLKIIVATSTLSSGVNLPARRVIIRSPIFGGGKIMDPLTYRQMIGRAGRTGKDILGESILICNESNSKAGKELIGTKPKPLSSCLNFENNTHLNRAVLEVISSGVATTKSDVELFLNCTLMHAQLKVETNIDTVKSDCLSLENNEININDCLEFLLEYEFIRLQNSDDGTKEAYYIPTRLGLACLSASMSPTDGIMLLSELQKSRQCFVLESELHAIYLVTPYSVCYQLQNIDWLSYLDMWERLTPAEKKVGEFVGVKETFLIKAMRSGGQNKLDYKLLQIHKRFYIALALQELVNEVQINKVAIKYNLSRGLLQSLQQMSSTFAGIVTSFCNSLNWKMLGLIVAQFKERLYFGVQHDLIDLMRLPDLNSQRARALYNAGYETLIDLAKANCTDIEKVLYNCISFDSEKQKDGEDEYETKKRNLMRNLYVTGKEGLTIKDAAKSLIIDARMFLKFEMGAQNINWDSSSIQNDLNNSDKNDFGSSLMQNSADVIVSNSPKRNEEHSKILVGNKDIIESLSSSLWNEKSFKQPNILNSNEAESKSTKFDSLQIIDVCGSYELFQETFRELLDYKKYQCLGLSLGIQKFSSKKKQPIIGGNMLDIQQFNSMGTEEEEEKVDFVIDENSYVNGISICIESNIVCFINLQNQNRDTKISSNMIRSKLKTLFNETTGIILRIFDAKEQLKILKSIIPSLNNKFTVKFEDPKVALWLIQPDSELNFRTMIEEYAPQCNGIADIAGNTKISSSIALNWKSLIFGKIRSSVEACVSFHILQNQLYDLHKLDDGHLQKIFYNIEMPIQVELFNMELIGFPVNKSALENLSKLLLDTIKQIEYKIYEIHGTRFNLSSSSAVARVLGLHKQKNGKISTSRQILEKIDSPIADLIINYRKLNVILTKTIQPLSECIKENRIFGKSFTFTATGRISMHEPNLQNVAKDFEINFMDNNKKQILISCRNCFMAPKGKSLISADFCQLEMRLLAHLSQDKSLLNIMKSETDIFTAIASKWNQIPENEVSESLRNGTKQICYGIIYGMGLKSLAESLKCTEAEAKCLLDQFHFAYPGIKEYIEKVLKFARLNGYVETITGRRRYLNYIQSTESGQRAQAERQAVNTIVQGSGADILKNAILKIKDDMWTKQQLKSKVEMLEDDKEIKKINLVLHLHDELIYEVPETMIFEVGKIIKNAMENCEKLSIPLRVRLKAGESWSTMKDLKI